MSCKCQECNKSFTVDLLVPDNVWEMIKPIGKPKGAGILCSSCIMKKIEDKYGYYVFKLKEHWNPSA